MNWYTRNLKQQATYWAPPVKDAWGDQTYPSPATVQCYWKDEATEFVSTSGAAAVSKAVVHVDSDVRADGFLYLGIISAGSPRGVPGADRIQQVQKQPTLRQDVIVYIAFL